MRTLFLPFDGVLLVDRTKDAMPSPLSAAFKIAVRGVDLPLTGESSHCDLL